jgi:hypothetical protein
MEYLALFAFGLALLFFCVVSMPAIIEVLRIRRWRRRQRRAWAKKWVVR